MNLDEAKERIGRQAMQITRLHNALVLAQSALDNGAALTSRVTENGPTVGEVIADAFGQGEVDYAQVSRDVATLTTCHLSDGDELGQAARRLYEAGLG